MKLLALNFKVILKIALIIWASFFMGFNEPLEHRLEGHITTDKIFDSILLKKKSEVGLDLQQHQLINYEWVLPVRDLPLINSRNLDIVSDYLL